MVFLRIRKKDSKIIYYNILKTASFDYRKIQRVKKLWMLWKTRYFYVEFYVEFLLCKLQDKMH